MFEVGKVSPNFYGMPVKTFETKLKDENCQETEAKTPDTEKKQDKDALMKFLTVMASLNAIKHSGMNTMNPMLDPAMNPALNPAMNPPTYVVPPMTVPGVPGGIMM